MSSNGQYGHVVLARMEYCGSMIRIFFVFLLWRCPLGSASQDALTRRIHGFFSLSGGRGTNETTAAQQVARRQLGRDRQPRALGGLCGGPSVTSRPIGYPNRERTYSLLRGRSKMKLSKLSHVILESARRFSGDNDNPSIHSKTLLAGGSQLAGWWK